MDKDRGEWVNQWTISLRIFDKAFERVEAIRDIRKRIEESHKQDQFFAGYVLDAVAEEYQDAQGSNEAESSLSFIIRIRCKIKHSVGCI